MATGRAGRARPSRWRLRRRGTARRWLDDEPEDKDTSCMRQSMSFAPTARIVLPDPRGLRPCPPMSGLGEDGREVAPS
uniref:Uncharacterized protein n=1 Tax=Oryza glumipatula TaxID=40148 RepID=A0A0D9Z334_9ORYZ